MTEMEKMKAGLEYSYADAELEARKTQAILWCEEYHAIDGRDFAAFFVYLHLRFMIVYEESEDFRPQNDAE